MESRIVVVQHVKGSITRSYLHLENIEGFTNHNVGNKKDTCRSNILLMVKFDREAEN